MTAALTPRPHDHNHDHDHGRAQVPGMARAGPTNARRGTPRVLVWLAVPATVSAVVGLAASYVAMRRYLDELGWLSYVAPAVIELTIGYLAVSMVYRTRCGHRWRPERLLVYAGITLAAYLNWGAYPDAPDAERAWHAAMPLLWSIAIEWAIAWARHLLHLEEPPREGVPAGVWVTRPIFALWVKRFMLLTAERSYTTALDRHMRHALARAEHHGADPNKLTRIRLRYAAVKPSQTALHAGEVEPGTASGTVSGAVSENGYGNVPSDGAGNTLDNTSSGVPGRGWARPSDTVNGSTRRRSASPAGNGHVSAPRSNRRGSANGRGAGLPAGVGSGRDLSPAQVADLISAGGCGLSVRQVMHTFAVSYTKATEALALANPTVTEPAGSTTGPVS